MIRLDSLANKLLRSMKALKQVCKKLSAELKIQKMPREKTGGFTILISEDTEHVINDVLKWQNSVWVQICRKMQYILEQRWILLVVD
ncbi:hypothetical protein D3C72_1565640 [compost metagenome]